MNNTKRAFDSIDLKDLVNVIGGCGGGGCAGKGCRGGKGKQGPAPEAEQGG